jgi:Protein of unknown function (DUF2934)
MRLREIAQVSIDPIGPNESVHDLIERGAYAIWKERGCIHGHDVDDWLKAEAEIHAQIQHRSSSSNAMRITRVILACDESGAKGYADQDEAYDGETGVFAAIMVPETHLASVEADFDAIYQKYKPTSGKLHIAELSAKAQEELRQDVYATVRKHRLPCFWYALHVAGVHRDHIRNQQLLAQAKSASEADSLQPGRFKAGSHRENPASIHVLLFEGLYGHLVAFLEERDRRNVEIEIRTDPVDNPIVDRFVEVARKLLEDKPLVHTSRRFDTVTEQVVQGQIKIEVQVPESLKISLTVRSLQIHPVDNDDGIVLGADVIANHLNYLFKHRNASEKYGRLNWPTAIQRHPLKDHLDAFNNWGSGDFVGDGVYKHPKASN